MPKANTLVLGWMAHPDPLLFFGLYSLPPRIKDVPDQNSRVETTTRRPAILNFSEDDDMLLKRDLDLRSFPDR